MTVPSVGSNNAQSIGTLLMQQLLANGSNSQGTGDLSGLLGDLMTLSPAAQQLSQAPAAVTQAMSDLFSGQKDPQGDLAQLKAYFQQNPQSLSSVLSTLQGGTGTYGATGASGSTATLLAALMKGQSNNPNSGALLNLLLGTQNQDPLLGALGDTSSGSGTSAFSLLG